MKNELTLPIFVLTDESGTLINDIDTDQIFHNRYLSIVDIDKMGQYALDNLDNYKDFPTRVKPGMLLVAGENFGSGSSRQQAVDCFKALKMEGISALSFGAIYKRNVINSGFPLIELKRLDDAVKKTGTVLTFNLNSGDIFDKSGALVGECQPISPVQEEIIEKGGLLHTVH
ncbi:3-isopropylmalate dehydratase [bacterium]|nr:3-isopropylmalate dehydratase [bacterium]